MAGSGVIFTHNLKYLIVEPTYKNSWEIPGGLIEQGEQPLDTAIREVKEELGIDFIPTNLAITDFSTKNQNYHYVYQGKELSNLEIKSIRLPEDELKSYKFVAIQEAEILLHPNVYKRLLAYQEYKKKSLKMIDGILIS